MLELKLFRHGFKAKQALEIKQVSLLGNRYLTFTLERKITIN